MNLETFKVERMDSFKSEQEVKETLEQVKGVQEAKVDIQTERASVRFDGQQTDVDSLKNEVRAEGYEVK